jgi:hypothetical protein
MANTGTVITLCAGGFTFMNEWLQTKEVNWRIPVATVILAALVDGIAHLDTKIATTFSVIILIGAVTVPINGKSPIEEIGDVLNTKATTTTTTAKKKATK